MAVKKGCFGRPAFRVPGTGRVAPGGPFPLISKASPSATRATSSTGRHTCVALPGLARSDPQGGYRHDRLRRFGQGPGNVALNLRGDGESAVANREFGPNGSTLSWPAAIHVESRQVRNPQCATNGTVVVVIRFPVNLTLRAPPVAVFQRPGEPSTVIAPLDLVQAGLGIRVHSDPVPAPFTGAVGAPTSIRACHHSIPPIGRLRTARITAGNRLTTYRAARSALSALGLHLLPSSRNSGEIASIRGNRFSLRTVLTTVSPEP